MARFTCDGCGGEGENSTRDENMGPGPHWCSNCYEETEKAAKAVIQTEAYLLISHPRGPGQRKVLVELRLDNPRGMFRISITTEQFADLMASASIRLQPKNFVITPYIKAKQLALLESKRASLRSKKMLKKLKT